MCLFDITELAEQVISHLTLQDLAVCVRVNKAWNTLCAPHLWHTLPPSFSPSGIPRHCLQFPRDYLQFRKSFPQLLLEDYLSARQCHQENEQYRRHTQTALSRNSHHIRDLQVNDTNITSPSSSSNSSHPPSTSSSTAATTAVISPDPTVLELMSHLVKRCTNVQKLELSWRVSNSREQEISLELASNGLPGTITDLDLSLHIGCHLLFFTPTLFSQGSAALRRLRISSYVNYHPEHNWVSKEQVDESVKQGTQEVEEEGLLPSLKELEMAYKFSKYPQPPLSHQFLRRCPNLETLDVDILENNWIEALRTCDNLKTLKVRVFKNAALPLAAVLKTALPNLDTINARYTTCTDEDMATMLSACRKGWRSVDIMSAGSLTSEALIKHCSTLETLKLTQASMLTSKHMQRILSNSPRLQCFVTLLEGHSQSWSREECTHIWTEDFIDADPSSGSLKPWACEASLKVFRAKISGVPRPDITSTFNGHPLQEGMVLQEAFPGQSREIQGRVYERLARLSRLERLELGHEDRDLDDVCKNAMSEKEYAEMEDEDQQYDCLDMTLKNGLWKLEGLREMRILGVERMTLMMGPEEEHWMRQHWLKLECVERDWDYRGRQEAKA